MLPLSSLCAALKQRLHRFKRRHPTPHRFDLRVWVVQFANQFLSGAPSSRVFPSLRAGFFYST